MISAWNLLWIVPCATAIGYILASLCATGKEGDDE